MAAKLTRVITIIAAATCTAAAVTAARTHAAYQAQDVLSGRQ